MTGLPYEVVAVLKSYDVAQLRWEDPADRYAIVREVLDRGGTLARGWLAERLTPTELRELVIEFGGAGMNEPLRARVRAELGISEDLLPVRPSLGFCSEREG